MKSLMNALLLLCMLFAVSSKADVKSDTKYQSARVQGPISRFESYSFGDFGDSVRAFQTNFKKMYYADGKLKKAKNDTPRMMDFYYGENKKKQPQGKGLMEYGNGDRYIGQWEMGKKSGYGKMVYKNGDVYEGNWKNDKRVGQGTLMRNNRDKSLYSFDDNRVRNDEEPVQFSGFWEDDALHSGKATCGDYSFVGTFNSDLGLDEGTRTYHRYLEERGKFKSSRSESKNHIEKYDFVDGTAKYDYSYYKFSGTVKDGQIYSGDFEYMENYKYMSGTISERSFSGNIAFFYNEDFESLFNYKGSWKNGMPVNGSGYIVLDQKIDTVPKTRPENKNVYMNYFKNSGKPLQVNAETIVPFQVTKQNNTYHINFTNWNENTSFIAKTPKEFNNILEERADTIHAAIVARELAEKKAAQEAERQRRIANINWDKTIDHFEFFVVELDKAWTKILRGYDVENTTFTIYMLMANYPKLLDELEYAGYKPMTKAQENRLNKLMKKAEALMSKYNYY